MLSFKRAFIGLISIATVAKAGNGDGYFNAFCSNENTAGDYQVVQNTYNSMGSCVTQCQSNYAFAVLQWKSCWCSNYVPANQISLSECSQKCPGYPDDTCGNQGQGLYGYVALDKQPLGTSPTSTKHSPTPPPSPTSTSQPPTSETPSSIHNPPSSSPAPSYSSDSSFSSSSSSSPPSSSSSLSSSSESTTKTSQVNTHMTTISGAPTTQTVTNTAVPASPGSVSNKPSLQRKGLSGGAIAGAVIGSLVGVGALILAAFLLWRRKRNGDDESPPPTNRSPKRKGSVLSRTGLLGAARPQSMSEANYDDSFNADPVTRTNSVRNSMMFGAGLGAEGVATAGPLGNDDGSGSQDSSSERRASRPFVYDQRLNPSALFANHDNGSRVSMQDQQDYSRPLGVSNPDFGDLRYSFDSR